MTKKQRYCYPKVRDNAQIIPNLNNFLKKNISLRNNPQKRYTFVFSKEYR